MVVKRPRLIMVVRRPRLAKPSGLLGGGGEMSSSHKAVRLL
jgi:hypothetical protein